jgi:hypothetical protein
MVFPIIEAAATIEIEISAPISAYSMALAPPSFW